MFIMTKQKDKKSLRRSLNFKHVEFSSFYFNLNTKSGPFMPAFFLNELDRDSIGKIVLIKSHEDCPPDCNNYYVNDREKTITEAHHENVDIL